MRLIVSYQLQLAEPFWFGQIEKPTVNPEKSNFFIQGSFVFHNILGLPKMTKWDYDYLGVVVFN